jgi:hypothetical protein
MRSLVNFAAITVTCWHPDIFAEATDGHIQINTDKPAMRVTCKEPIEQEVEAEKNKRTVR